MNIFIISMIGQAVITFFMLPYFINAFGRVWGIIHLLILNTGIFLMLYLKMRREEKEVRSFTCIYCNTPFTSNEFGSSCRKCDYTLIPKEYGI